MTMPLRQLVNTGIALFCLGLGAYSNDSQAQAGLVVAITRTAFSAGKAGISRGASSAAKETTKKAGGIALGAALEAGFTWLKDQITGGQAKNPQDAPQTSEREEPPKPETRFIRLVELKDDQWRYYTKSSFCYIEDQKNVSQCHPCRYALDAEYHMSCVPTTERVLELRCPTVDECIPLIPMTNPSPVPPSKSPTQLRLEKIEAEKKANREFVDGLRCDNRRDINLRAGLPWAKLVGEDDIMIGFYSYPGFGNNELIYQAPVGRYVKIVQNIDALTPPSSMPNARKFSCVSIEQKDTKKIKYGFIKSVYLNYESPNLIERTIDRDKY